MAQQYVPRYGSEDLDASKVKGEGTISRPVSDRHVDTSIRSARQFSYNTKATSSHQGTAVSGSVPTEGNRNPAQTQKGTVNTLEFSGFPETKHIICTRGKYQVLQTGTRPTHQEVQILPDSERPDTIFELPRPLKSVGFKALSDIHLVHTDNWCAKWA